ncbi:hypothetical protein AVEN_104907-1, partial [Araneus ventricosus]
MVSFTAPYLIPLFLGMTFDARYSKPGVDIYDSQYVNDPVATLDEDGELHGPLPHPPLPGDDVRRSLQQTGSRHLRLSICQRSS